MRAAVAASLVMMSPDSFQCCLQHTVVLNMQIAPQKDACWHWMTEQSLLREACDLSKGPSQAICTQDSIGPQLKV